MTDNPFEYELPVKAYDPINETVTKTRPTGEQYNEEVVVGYQADPPPSLTAPNLEQLRYSAALIEIRTGIKVRVAPKMVKVDLPFPDDDEPKDVEFYEVLTSHATGGPAAYEVTWAWLSGFENGIMETLRQ